MTEKWGISQTSTTKLKKRKRACNPTSRVDLLAVKFTFCARLAMSHHQGSGGDSMGGGGSGETFQDLSVMIKLKRSNNLSKATASFASI